MKYVCNRSVLVTTNICILQLSISNPTDKEVIFDVACEGEGVSGPPTVSVGPKTEACYEILYKPTFIGKSAGKVVFVSEELGKLFCTESLVSLTKYELQIRLLQTPQSYPCSCYKVSSGTR